MINLEDFLFKHVIVTDIDGIVYKGLVDFHETPYENESDEDSIGILTNEADKEGVELYQSEIVSIEVYEP